MPETLAYGTWDSPISAESLVTGAVGISEVVPQAESVWWAESRPSESGRTALMRWQAGEAVEITPNTVNVRSTVHEYGGGSWWVDEEVAYFVDFSDQRLYRLQPQGQPSVLSPPASIPRGLRFADFRLTPDKHWIIAVAEEHKEGSEPQNKLLAVSTDGSLTTQLLAEGADFYGSPRISPDGRRICWVQWDHPNMPWDDTELYVAELQSSASGISVSNQSVVAGGPGEAIVQPEWSPQNQLHYLSDRADLWHLYRENHTEAVFTCDGEIGYPPWVFGLSRYAFRSDGTVVAARYLDSIEHLDGFEGYTAFHSIRTHGDNMAFAAASWQQEATVFYNNEAVKKPRSHGYAEGILGAAEAISFPSGQGEEAHALYFAAGNPAYAGPQDEKPPLIVLAHGGPTSQARSQLSMARQFWTSRGFAVVDVNYRGSSGYGRRYRKKLEGNWGVADVEDCVSAAQFLVDRGDVDPDRLIIRGGSAGGFTVLSALAFHDTFTAGANMYGVADLEALASDTHKFESRYLDRLVGPYPGTTELYRQRSPIRHLEGFNVPLIVLQGSEDAIVPPNQSRMIVEALDEKRVPVAYLEFPGEQHGFRKAETIKTALLSELAFYGRVFGFTPAGESIELEIKHLAG